MVIFVRLVLNSKSMVDIDKYLKEGLEKIDLGGTPKELYDPIEYIFSIGGKRIRPRLSLLAYSLFSDKIDSSIINPILGLEIFHTFTLIHDDIMDKADMRRGKETIHKKWNDNIAILSGDVMSIQAYQFISKAPAGHLPKVLELFNRTAAQVCEGQQYDMNFEDIPIISMDEYMKMIGLKTAVLLACSAKMGAILAGADDKSAQLLYDYGYLLGIAFQIADDYLDNFGDPKIFGKNIGGDITNNKKSWLFVECYNTATGAEKERWEKIVAMPPEQAEQKIREAQIIYTELGIKEKAEKEIDKYYKMAIEKVEELNISTEQLEQLVEFAKAMTFRNK